MIIDGKLTVSKKKKQVLVQELRKLNFKPFSKLAEAKAEGENEDAIEEESEEEQESGIGDYDYLLGMAIWSLTQEKVEKLLKQIGDKEVEIDTLIKLTPKDLWTRDLDDFIVEWRNELDDESKRDKKSRQAGRRGSSKLGLAGKGPKRKRKDENDDDFIVGKKKPAVKSVVNRVKEKKPSTLMSFFTKNPEEKQAEPSASTGAADNDDFMDIDHIDKAVSKQEDGSDDDIVPIKKRGRPAKDSTTTSKSKTALAKPTTSKVKAKTKVDDGSDDVDDIFAALEKETGSRKPASGPPPRRAAAKKGKYVEEDSGDSDNNDDDILGDVSMMVKGIGNKPSSSTSNVRPLFSAKAAARPSSQSSSLNKEPTM